MKFKKKINVCRYDGFIRFEVIMNRTGYGLKCPSYKDGICLWDINREPCKVFEYERKDK
jgi:hypothetical protein